MKSAITWPWGRARLLWAAACLVASTGCSGRGATDPGGDEFGTTAIARVSGRALSAAGTPLAGASVIVLTPGMTTPSLSIAYDAPATNTGPNGEFTLTVRRVLSTRVGVGLDMVRAQIIAKMDVAPYRRPDGSAPSRANSVLLTFVSPHHPRG